MQIKLFKGHQKTLTPDFFPFWLGKIGKISHSMRYTKPITLILGVYVVEGRSRHWIYFFNYKLFTSRVTSDIVISIQTQVTGGYIGETGISTLFFRTVA